MNYTKYVTEIQMETERQADILDRDTLKQKLYCNGSIGLDLSPGDPVALAAYHTICSLEKEIAEFKAVQEKTSRSQSFRIRAEDL